MTESYKILAKYIKDMSSETPDVETFLFVKENISRYQLNIDINSKAIKNKLVEINIRLKFEDKEQSEKKSYYEIIYAVVIKVNDDVKDKKILEKIVLVEVQKEIFPEIEKTLINLLHNSGYPAIKIEKKVDFEELYKKNFN